MEQWNKEQISQSFRRQAEEAERYCGEVRSKIKHRPSYKDIFDEHMAKFYVYNRLHGRTFLDSREELLSELRTMLTMDFSSAECFDAERFESHRKAYINAEINGLTNT